MLKGRRVADWLRVADEVRTVPEAATGTAPLQRLGGDFKLVVARFSGFTSARDSDVPIGIPVPVLGLRLPWPPEIPWKAPKFTLLYLWLLATGLDCRLASLSFEAVCGLDLHADTHVLLLDGLAPSLPRRPF